jgi:transposase
MLSSEKKVCLACGATDLRKSIDALSVLVRESFKLDPFDDALFVFCNRNRDIIKILEWGGDGFWIHMKKIERGRFNRPASKGDKIMPIAFRELEILIESTRLRSKLRREQIFSPITDEMREKFYAKTQ